MSLFDSNVAEVPVDDIKVGVTLKNIRTHFDPKGIVELAASIHRDGLMNPLIIQEVEDDNQQPVIELIAGERRLRAIQYIIENIDDEFLENGVSCIQYLGGIHDAKFVNASENIDREEVDDVDVAAWLSERVDDGVTQTELAKKLNKTLQWVNFRTLFHARASDEVKKALRDGLISFSAAYELSKNHDEEDQDKWIKKSRTLHKKITIEDAKNAGTSNTVPRPNKKARSTMLARAETITDASGSEVAKGAAHALRWIEGLITDTQLEEVIGWED